MKDMGSTDNSGKFSYEPIRSPKETEDLDGVQKATSKTLPAGAAKPDRGGHGLGGR